MSDQGPIAEDIAQRIPGYRIMRELGRGGMSVLYLAEDLSFPRPRRVALKVLASSLAQDERFRRRFEREAQVLSDLDHPHIIPIYSAGESGGLLYLAMRYVDSGDLRLLLDTMGPLTFQHATSIISQVADALDAAHAEGLVHRDVKPENILVDRRGGTGEHCYLSDFGITKNIISGESFTIARQFIGSVYFAAPEQIEGGQVDRRADVYSLGCVLYQCLTGQVPFPRDDTAAVLMAHVTAPPPSVRDLRPELPAQTSDIVAKALAKKPEDRYATCGDLAAALRRVAPPAQVFTSPTDPARPTVTVLSPILPSPPAKRAARRRWPLAVGAGVLALVLVGALVWTRTRFPNPREEALRGLVVPAAFRDTCGRDAPSPRAEGTQAAIRCEPDEGADAVAYASFASAGALEDAYEQVVEDAGVEPGAPGDCDVSARAEHLYEGAGGMGGRLLCYRETGSSHLVWTDVQAQVLATATRADGDGTQIYAWWQDLVERPDFPTPQERSLLDVIPEASQVSCHRAHDLGDRPGAVAGVTCLPLSGAASVTYYQFSDLQSMDAVYDGRVRELSPPEAFCGDAPPGFLGQDTYLLGESTVMAGSAVCHTSPRGDAVIEWTRDDVLVFAVASGRDPNALAQWWSSGDSGPISPDAPPSEEPFTPDELALLGRIPLASRVGCERATDVADFPGAIAGVRCEPTSGALGVWYYRFPDQASMQAVYDSRVQSVAPPAGLFCSQLPPDFEAESGYVTNDIPAGRFLCWTDSEGRPWLEWTDDSLFIFSQAVGTDPNALVVWWGNEAGPT
ncbi:MAG: serine/threonine-protein kinase [Egibacteraceae bacterium]